MGQQVEVIPHLSFHGDCEEAIQTYISAFGGEVYYLSRWNKDTFDQTEEQIGKVMHAEFALGQTRLAASDAFGQRQDQAGIKLMVHLDTMEEARKAVDILARGGACLSTLKPHPAPDDAGCGSITRDRFGYTWIVTCPNPAKGSNE